jgi:tryptophanyl-tRNA synthetase
MAFKERVFSGMQPTGSLHLGNYLGAMVNWIKLQETHECIYCVVDLHAITVWQDPDELKRAIRQVTAAYIASGLDPKRSILFNQSNVTAHAELAWVFNCVARYGWLNRMTQFKEKAGKDKEKASVGLFVYPNLMAADILAYRATHVPVGDDQKQHLELARDIAQKFNNDFKTWIERRGHADGAFFPLPEPVITGPATRVMSLRDGMKKMSKSDPSDMSRINLMDDDDVISEKIKKAKTDMDPLPNSVEQLEARSEINNLVGIYAALVGASKEHALDVLVRTSTQGPSYFTHFKRALTEVLIEKLRPIRQETRRLMGDAAEIDRILADGAARARAIAKPILEEVKDIVGFVRS